MFVGALSRRARGHFVTYGGGCCWCSAAAASGGQSGAARRRRPVDYGVGSGGSGGVAHTQCVRLSYCRVSFNVSREHSPGLSASRACMAFALSGAKHTVPLFRLRLRLKPDSKFCAGTWDRTLEIAHMVYAFRDSMFLGVVLFAK
jgi:hypothetical protein